MIKRSGVNIVNKSSVNIMNARTGNVKIAKETLEIIKAKQYTSPSFNLVDISNELDNAVKETILYYERADAPYIESIDIAPTIEVTNETTTQAAVRLLKDGKKDI